MRVVLRRKTKSRACFDTNPVPMYRRMPVISLLCGGAGVVSPAPISVLGQTDLDKIDVNTRAHTVHVWCRVCPSFKPKHALACGLQKYCGTQWPVHHFLMPCKGQDESCGSAYGPFSILLFSLSFFPCWPTQVNCLFLFFYAWETAAYILYWGRQLTRTFTR